MSQISLKFSIFEINKNNNKILVYSYEMSGFEGTGQFKFFLLEIICLEIHEEIIEEVGNR